MIPRPSLDSFRRFLRQERDDLWAVRLLRRIVFGLAAAYTLFTLASTSMSSFITICAVLVLAVLLWLMRGRGQLLLALTSTLFTAAVAGYFAAAGEIAGGSATGLLGGQTVFGYWALALMTLLGAWIPKTHPGRRGVTVVLADMVLLVTSAASTVFPAASVPMGFLGLTLVLVARGGGFAAAKRRIGRMKRFSRRPVPAADTDR
uniref:Integral membrane protein n=1 Tax=Streptomyces sp. NBC_00049 TaxID=2903617 RepID=A0AAU2JTE2_9ACTN